MTQKYVLVERHSQPSRYNGVQMWRLVWYGLTDGVLYEMTVDASYRNFRRQGWDHIVHDPSPWGVYQGLRRTRRETTRGVPVLTADGRPELIYRAVDLAEAMALVELNEQELNPPPTLYQDLFTVDHEKSAS